MSLVRLARAFISEGHHLTILQGRIASIGPWRLFIDDTVTPGVVDGGRLQDVAVEVIDVQAAMSSVTS